MKKSVVFCLSIFLLFLCGCKTGYREIDRGYLVSSIGFDKQEDVIQIYIEALSSSDVKNDASNRVVLKGQGYTFEQAFDNINLQLVKPLYFEQIGSAVFNPLLISEGVAFLQSIPNVHLDVFVVATNSVTALFECESPGGMLGYDIIGLIKTHNKSSPFLSQLFTAQYNTNSLPIVDFIDGKLIYSVAGG